MGIEFWHNLSIKLNPDVWYMQPNVDKLEERIWEAGSYFLVHSHTGVVWIHTVAQVKNLD